MRSDSSEAITWYSSRIRQRKRVKDLLSLDVGQRSNTSRTPALRVLLDLVYAVSRVAAVVADDLYREISPAPTERACHRYVLLRSVSDEEKIRLTVRTVPWQAAFRIGALRSNANDPIGVSEHPHDERSEHPEMS